MNVATLLVVFTLSWWLAFFTLLPIGNQSHAEADQDPGFGGEEGAPVRPRLRRKALIATAIAIALTLAYAAAVVFGGFSLRSLFGRSP
ncbi:MAG: DUF1467 family protein [Rhodothalassiaceae bacterium]